MNVAEILKDCPKETKFYSPICGECELEEIIGNYIVVRVPEEEDKEYTFYHDGKYYNNLKGECLLFPSKENRDWSTFNPKKEHQFKPFDKVLVRDYEDENGIWCAALFSHYYEDGGYCASGIYWRQCIPYAGNEHLLGTTNNPEQL